MIEEERPPGLRRRSPSTRHVLANRGLADVDAELEEFSMDAGNAIPGLQGHCARKAPATGRLIFANWPPLGLFQVQIFGTT